MGQEQVLDLTGSITFQRGKEVSYLIKGSMYVLTFDNFIVAYQIDNKELNIEANFNGFYTVFHMCMQQNEIHASIFLAAACSDVFKMHVNSCNPK